MLSMGKKKKAKTPKRKTKKAASSAYDVFISYSSKDKDWVRGELLTELENAGVTVFIDYRDFTRGAPSIKECERGIVECRWTLLVLTPNYVESGWTEIENIMAQSRDPANQQLRILPLMKAGCELPLRIASLTYIDFQPEADQNLAWRQLLTALGKPPADPDPQTRPDPETWFLAHPYPMPPHFTGRVAERQMLTAWLGADPTHALLSLRALGGFGKSALTWQWLVNDVDPVAWPRVVWWSFYETGANFESFLANTLNYLSGGKLDLQRMPGRDQVATLLQLLRGPGVLLVLDGFERELRAFSGMNAAYQGDETREPPAPEDDSKKSSDLDCLSALAEMFLHHAATLPNLKSKILLTTRLCPNVLVAKGGGLLAGGREEELRQLHPDDAIAYFQARGIRGNRGEIAEVCERYGGHPLSLGLLAGLILSDFELPADIAAANREDLDVSGDLVQRQHHVLEASWNGLPAELQQLLGRIACFRGPVDLRTLETIAEGDSAAAALRELVDRGLLHHDRRTKRFDLHPIVRRYAYDRLAATDRAGAHTQLRDYFAAIESSGKVTCLEDLEPVIELYHHTLRAGQPDEAFVLFRDRLTDPLYFQLGAYGLIIDLLSPLFPQGEDQPPCLKDEGDQAWTMNTLANACSLSGQPHRAAALYEQHNALREEQGNQGELALGLGNLACMALIQIGQLREAEANLRRVIEICREIDDELMAVVGHLELGRLLAFRGAETDAETELATAGAFCEKQDHVQGQDQVQAYSAQRELRRIRRARAGSATVRIEADSPTTADPKTALEFAQRALELAEETAKRHYPVEGDFVRAHWLLGAAHRENDQPTQAERHLHEALERCRRINLVELEPDILIDLARLHFQREEPAEAQRLAEEARAIAERSGYVLREADARLELAKLAQTAGDLAEARAQATRAHELATCDGPPHIYAAAYEEAEALLAQLPK